MVLSVQLRFYFFTGFLSLLIVALPLKVSAFTCNHPGSGDSLIKLGEYKRALAFYRACPDENTGRHYLNIGKVFFHLKYLDSALYYYQAAAESARNQSDLRLEGMAHFNQGSVYTSRGEYAEGIAMTQKALQTFKSLKDDEVVGQAYYNLGLLYKKNALFAEAILNLDSALNSFEQLEEGEKVEAKIFQLLGNIYREREEYSPSISYHKRAIALKNKLNDREGLYASYNDLGNTYRKSGYHEKALNYYQKALGSENPLFIGSTLDNIGETYFNLKQYEKALEYFNQSLKIRNEIGDQNGVALTLTELGGLYLALGREDKAFTFLEKGFKIAREKGYREILLSNYQWQKRLWAETGEFQKALVMSDSIALIKEQLFKESQEKIFQSMKISLRLRDIEREKQRLSEETKIKSLMLEQARSEKRLTAIILGLILLGAVVVIALVYRNAKWQKERSREIQHRTKNFLQTLANLYDFQSRRINDPGARAIVQESEGRVNAMLMIHNSLSGLSNRVLLESYLENLIYAIKSSFEPEHQSVSVTLNITPLQLEADQATPLALIVNELVTNSFKYGFSGKDEAELSVELQSHDRKDYLLEIRNSGTFEDGGTRADSYGLKMVRVFARQLGGDFKITSENDETVARVRMKLRTASP